MNKVEDKLCDKLWFGISLTPKEQAQGQHVPTLWDVCHDLQTYIDQGLLVEIPLNCTLAEIFEAEKYRSKTNRPQLRLLEVDYFGKDMRIQFKTIPGNTLYELVFSKNERSAHSGLFKKVT